MIELKYCPFCGGEAKVQRFPRNYSVYCTECGSRTMLFKPTEEEAVEAWNRRVNSEPSARWIDFEDGSMCSWCGASHDGVNRNYCPNCGKRMNGLLP